MRKIFGVLLLLAVALIGSPVYAQSAEITPEQLANATYTGIYEDAVTLTDGRWEGEPFVPGGTSRPTIEITGHTVVGDFDNDGAPEAAVLLVENGGGTGNFYYLSVLRDVDGQLANVGTVFVGDRIGVEDFSQDEFGIRLVATMHGPTDADCCPSMRVRQEYVVQTDSVRLTAETILGSTYQDQSPISVQTLANATYPFELSSGPEVTLTDGEFVDRDASEFVYMDVPPAFGDLDGDGTQDAVAFLEYSGGGSGRFMYLYAVLNSADGPEVAAWTELESPIQLNAAWVDNGQIVLEATVMGPGDAQCCPSLDTTIVYALDGDKLVLKAQEEDLGTVLSNLTYPADVADSGVITLTDGVYLDPGAEDAAAFSDALSGFIAGGDLNGDDSVDAAAVLVHLSEDGTATYDLYAVLDQDGVWTPFSPVRMGENIEMLNLTVANGEIVAGANVFGPDDEPCCPTQTVEQRYAVEDGALTLVDEQTVEAVLYGAAGITPGGEFHASADATTATINAGGTDAPWLDPMLVSVQSGAAGAPAVDAQTLGETCAGYVPAQPDVVLNWSEDPSVDTLRLFILSTGDPVMTVVTPAGDVLCNDDYTPLVEDSYLEIPNPESGRYAIFVGSFEDAAITPGFLVVTSHDLSPATLDLSMIMPRVADPSLARQSLPAESMLVDATPQASADTTLSADNTPYTADIVAGGDLPAFDVELGNELCTGFITPEPTVAFSWTGDDGTLGVMVEADEDTTLIVRDAEGTYNCNDDAGVADNLNPALNLTAASGEYQVWVGSFDPDVQPQGTLTVGAEALTPIVLTAPDNAQ